MRCALRFTAARTYTTGGVAAESLESAMLEDQWPNARSDQQLTRTS